MMKAPILLLLTVTLFPAASFSNPSTGVGEGDAVVTLAQAGASARGTYPSGGCADFSQLRGLCSRVMNKTAGDLIHFDYAYEESIARAACADPNIDSEELMNRKIREMWHALEDRLSCDLPSFDVPHGSVLKYAVKTQAFYMLELAAEVWQVNLNKVDRSDNRTLLDYVSAEMERVREGSVFEDLQHYYRLLRRAGAKHRSEL